jgi:SAM-dependent methyltransferase
MNGTISLYQRSKNILWTDKYVSKQMLKFHLDTTNDAASRNMCTIEDTIKWIQQNIPTNCSIVDLGCGPGLYAEKFAEEGYGITGMDISNTSIKYAKNSAREKKLNINYYNRSYITQSIPGKHEVALCIYCDFGALTPNEQDVFLHNVSKSLCSNGIFIFDVFSESLSLTKKEEQTWEYVNANGFWSKNPHYVLRECKYFDDAKAWGTRNVIIEKNKVREFITWDTMYTKDRLCALLEKHGYAVENIETNLVTKSNFTSNDVLFIKARKN